MEGERVKYGRETMFVSGCGTHGELVLDKRRDKPSQGGQKPTMVSNNIPVPMAPAFRAEFSKRLYQHSMKLMHSSSASAADGRFLSHPAYSHHFHGIPNANHVIYLPLSINTTSRTETRPKERQTVSQDYKKKSKMAAYADMNGNRDELDANGKPRSRLPGNRLTPLSKYSREQTDAGESRTIDDADTQLKRDQTYYSVGSSLSNVSHLQQLYQRSGDGISNLSRDALLDPQLQQSDSPSLSRSETELSTNPGYYSSGYPNQHTDKSQFDRIFGGCTSIPPSTSAVKKAVRFQSSDDLDSMKTGTHLTGKFPTDAGQEPSIRWPPGSMSKKTARQLSPSEARKMWRKQDEIETSMADSSEDSRFLAYSGPKPGVKYPLSIHYCPPDICDGWPLEYCDYHPGYEKAKEWMDKNLTDDMRDVFLGEGDDGGAEGGDGEKKKRQTRGGRGVIKTKQKQDIEKKICLSRSCRGKKKYVTIVTGLSTYEIDLKVASKFFGSRFACGSSVTGDDEIVIQGDVKDDLFDILLEKWPMIDEDTIDDLGDQKR